MRIKAKFAIPYLNSKLWGKFATKICNRNVVRSHSFTVSKISKTFIYPFTDSDSDDEDEEEETKKPEKKAPAAKKDESSDSGSSDSEDEEDEPVKKKAKKDEEDDDEPIVKKSGADFANKSFDKSPGGNY